MLTFACLPSLVTARTERTCYRRLEMWASVHSTPVSPLQIGNSIQSTSDFSAWSVPRRFQINDLYTNTGSFAYATMSIFSQAGASANSSSSDVALQVDNYVPSSSTVNYSAKIGIQAFANNAGSGTNGIIPGAATWGYYSGTNTAAVVYGAGVGACNSSTGAVTFALAETSGYEFFFRVYRHRPRREYFFTK